VRRWHAAAIWRGRRRPRTACQDAAATRRRAHARATGARPAGAGSWAHGGATRAAHDHGAQQRAVVAPGAVGHAVVQRPAAGRRRAARARHLPAGHLHGAHVGHVVLRGAHPLRAAAVGSTCTHEATCAGREAAHASSAGPAPREGRCTHVHALPAMASGAERGAAGARTSHRPRRAARAWPHGAHQHVVVLLRVPHAARPRRLGRAGPRGARRGHASPGRRGRAALRLNCAGPLRHACAGCKRIRITRPRSPHGPSNS
jgi:hypothetical protein